VGFTVLDAIESGTGGHDITGSAFQLAKRIAGVHPELRQ
jgi:hypothetical protein